MEAPDAESGTTSTERHSPDPALSDHQNAALHCALERGHVSTAWYVQNLGISRDTAWRTLDELKDKGYLEKEGAGRGIRYVPGGHMTEGMRHSGQAQIGRKPPPSGAKGAKPRRKIND